MLLEIDAPRSNRQIDRRRRALPEEHEGAPCGVLFAMLFYGPTRVRVREILDLPASLDRIVMDLLHATILSQAGEHLDLSEHDLLLLPSDDPHALGRITMGGLVCEVAFGRDCLLW